MAPRSKVVTSADANVHYWRIILRSYIARTDYLNHVTSNVGTQMCRLHTKHLAR
ncbi:MAG TPA: hypothetical protein VFA65_08550 [Bryobacteraceae bacterium]|nr:hypothetical protein [Bryobacteraceae bacterium]